MIQHSVDHCNQMRQVVRQIVPQALNRFAAKPIGQPGVPQAAANRGGVGLADTRDSTVSNSIGSGIGTYVVEPLAVSLSMPLHGT